MKIATQLFFILSLMQILFYVKSKSLGCLIVYAVTFLISSYMTKKILHILLVSSLTSISIFDCGNIIKEGALGSISAMCPDTLIPINLESKSLSSLNKAFSQCKQQKKVLENNLAVKSMSDSEKTETKKEIENIGEKIRYIEESISNKTIKTKKTQ
tara:strand:+ start:259 stop:726 length:468 start_codon:yes stop_codon:yes gene_type:complete